MKNLKYILLTQCVLSVDAQAASNSLTVSSLSIRSLAYNNLETLPKDVFKGMDALTKV